MADFRKWLFAFAVLALMLGASTAYAQIPSSDLALLPKASLDVSLKHNPYAVVAQATPECYASLLKLALASELS